MTEKVAVTPQEIKHTPGPEDIPDRMYPCAFEVCREMHTFPADMLFWHDGSEGPRAGFYCDICWNEHDDLWQVERDGRSLAGVLEPLEAAAACMLDALVAADHDLYGRYGDALEPVIVQVRAAIAKAKGDT